MRKIPLLLFIVLGTFCFGKLCHGVEPGEKSGSKSGDQLGKEPGDEAGEQSKNDVGNKPDGRAERPLIDTFGRVPRKRNVLMESVRY